MCRHQFEISDDELRECPNCGADAVPGSLPSVTYVLICEHGMLNRAFGSPDDAAELAAELPSDWYVYEATPYQE